MERERYDVVVVDDADEVRSVVGTQLRLSGRFTVVGEGATGKEAIELAARYRPAIVVLDASMPDIDGLEALPRIVEASPDSKVVMLSGFSGPALEAAARNLGASDFVEKAAPLRDLLDRLLRLLEALRRTRAPPVRQVRPRPGWPRPGQRSRPVHRGRAGPRSERRRLVRARRKEHLLRLPAAGGLSVVRGGVTPPAARLHWRPHGGMTERPKVTAC